MLKSQRMRSAKHVAVSMEEKKNEHNILVGDAEGIDHFYDLGEDRILILKRISKDWKVWTGFIWLRTGREVKTK
jgi:hypothetical protein